MSGTSPFSSFFMGGFECSSHRRPSGRRIDVIDASRHDFFAHQDYARLAELGLLTARDGLRWHLIEDGGAFDFRSVRRQVAAASEMGVQVIWDLLHYGYPDDTSPFAADFPERFARFAQAATAFLRSHTEGPLWFCPINELSFMAWGGGEVAYMNPFAVGRGSELKAALVRASIAGMDAARQVDPQVRFLHAEPLIHVRPHPARWSEQLHAEAEHETQFSALDWLLGRARPELGGGPQYVDMLGLNFYPYNQWRYHPDPAQREVIDFQAPAYVPLSTQLQAVHQRYGLPLLLAETGAEDHLRAPWLREVVRQTALAQAAGVPVHGICLYPIVNHPGWDDDRHCHNGLWDYPDARGDRPADPALLAALTQAQVQFRPASGLAKL